MASRHALTGRYAALASCHDCEAVVASFRQGWNIRVLAAEKMTPVRCTDAMP
jgi:hypothetical protein